MLRIDIHGSNLPSQNTFVIYILNALLKMTYILNSLADFIQEVKPISHRCPFSIFDGSFSNLHVLRKRVTTLSALQPVPDNTNCPRQYKLSPTIQTVPDNTNCPRQYKLSPTIQTVPDNTNCPRQYKLSPTIQTVPDNTNCPQQYTLSPTIHIFPDNTNTQHLPGVTHREIFSIDCMTIPRYL